jgi:hypothetical protein
MIRAVLQPSGNHDARAHYVDTVESPVDFAAHSTLLSPALMETLMRVHPSGTAAMWGVTPGANAGNANKWRRIAPGDMAFFARQGKIYACGTITATFHNAALAAALWGRDANGATWEYMYPSQVKTQGRVRN